MLCNCEVRIILVASQLLDAGAMSYLENAALFWEEGLFVTLKSSLI